MLCADFSLTAPFYSIFASLCMRASTRGAFIRSTLTAPLATRRRHNIFFEGFVGSNQNMTESAVVTHTGTKPCCKHFVLFRGAATGFPYLLSPCTDPMNASSLNRFTTSQKGTTLSKTDGSRKSPRKCGPDKRTRSRFKKNCTTNKVSFNTCKCSKRPRTGTYSYWTGAYKRRNETSSRIRR